MKKTILAIILLCCFNYVDAQTVWMDFEGVEKAEMTYTDGTLYFPTFYNNVKDSVNMSDTVCKYTRSATATYDVIIYEPDSSIKDLSKFISGAAKMSMKLYTSVDTGTVVQITLEDKNTAFPANYPTGRHSEYQVKTSIKDGWENLKFELINQPDNSVPDTAVNRLVILFNIGTNTSDDYYFDSLVGPDFNIDTTVSDTTTEDTTIEDSTTNINISNKADDIVVYPNPVQNNLIIIDGGTQKLIKIELYTLQGALVIKQEVNGYRNYMDLSSIQRGSYILRSTLATGKIVAKKITK